MRKTLGKRWCVRLVGALMSVSVSVVCVGVLGACVNKTNATLQGDVQSLVSPDNLFRDFVEHLSASDLEGGNCVGHSLRFAAELTAKGIEEKRIRIVLIARPPNNGMPVPLVPQAAFVRGQPVKFWTWHAVVLLDGKIFDPKYVSLIDGIEVYSKNMWGNIPADAMIFVMPPSRISEIQGVPYPGAAPRMMQFRPVNFDFLIKNPEHISQKRT